ncbi:MAG TPA: Mur ligase family protein [Candidatus Saccharimonadales bacterium]|nr:Mur ligase family protein [Candidatus Saccharimonadales bacterium]
MIQGLASLYSWRLPQQLLRMLAAQDYRAWPYLKTFWQTQDFSREIEVRHPVAGWASFLLYMVAVLELALGVAYVWLWHIYGLIGGLEFGVALILAYPLVLAHLLVLPILLWRLLHPKATGKAFLTAMLSHQVRRLRTRHSFKVVGVAGSVGKTSTKIAVARLLSASAKVQWQEGNYNDPVTVPLIFFGHSQPHIFNIVAWARILLANERMLRRPYPYKYVVAELGTDTPGTIKQFAYLKPDLVIITAVTPEHMEYFGTLDAVAAEELTALRYAKQSLVNIDDVPAAYLKDQTYLSFGLTSKATYYVSKRKSKAHHGGQTVTFYVQKDHKIDTHIALLGEQGAKVAVAAVAAGHVLGLDKHALEAGIATLAAFAGRMQVLPGVKNSTLIDDTYNASPVAAKAALDVLYSGSAPQRIAILGSMNELGDYSPEAHTEVGEYCDPKKLDLVITIGRDAERYLAPAAQARGCTVMSFTSPYDAGNYVLSGLEEGAVVLAKGSQNRVFAEEALKALLADPEDAHKLVRQSPYWLKIKRKQFKP